MSLCRAAFGNGQPCRYKAKVGTQFCGKHSGATITKGGAKGAAKVFKKTANNVKMPRKKINQALVLAKLREKMQIIYGITYKDWEIFDPKLVSNQKEIKTFANEFVKDSVYKFVLRDKTTYTYLWEQPDAFPLNRSMWLRISWMLNDVDYEALTMTCKSLNRLLIQDKTWFVRHPLHKIVHICKIFHMPLFRLLYIPVPKELSLILQKLRLPSVRIMMDEYISKQGPFPSNLLERQFEGEIIKNLLERVLSMHLLDDEDIAEVVPGAGLFQNVKTKINIELLEPVKHMKFVLNGETLILLHVSNQKGASKAISSLLRNLVGYDGKNIYRTLRFL